MKLFIVTGASKGLGEALMRALIQPGHRLVGIARSGGERLCEEAAAAQVPLMWINYDLVDTGGLEALTEAALAGSSDGQTAWGDLNGVYLIHNAGTLAPMAPIERCQEQELSHSMALNAVAPMTMTAALLRLTADWPIDRRILNISSGAGKSPYPGWSAYCSSKAALDMFTRCVGEEQRTAANPARVLSVAPGIVDTDMQRQIRDTSAELFPRRDRFEALYQTGALQSPSETAVKLLDVMFDEQYPTGSVLDVRDL